MQMQINPWFNSALGLTLSLGVGLNAALTLPATAQNQTDSFVDVASDYWASDYIEALAALDILNGFPDNTFRPYDPLTRAQFATIVRQAFLDDSAPTTTASFTDVPETHWAIESINAAYTAEFLSGYPNNVFRPEQDISRAHALIALTNGLALEASEDDSATLAYYTDADSIADYARAPVATATEANLVVNYPVLSRLDPNRRITRAEVAAFIYQALLHQGRVEALAENLYVVSETATSWRIDPIATIPLRPEQMAFSDSGQRLMTLTSERDSLKIWNTQTGESLAEVAAEAETRFEGGAISGSGTRAAAIVQTLSTNALELQLWNLETGEQLWRQSLGTVQSQFRPEVPSFLSSPVQVAFLPGDEGILTQTSLGFGPADGPAGIQVRIHDFSTGEVLQTLETLPAAPPIEQFEFSPNRELVVGISQTASGLNTEAAQVIDVWQLSDGAHLNRIPSGAEDFWITDLAFAPDSDLRIFSQQFYDIRLDTWNVRSGEHISRITELPEIDRTDGFSRLSPDGEYYFVRSNVAGTRLINTRTQVVTPLNVFVGGAGIFNATGTYLAVPTNQDEIKIFSQVEP